MTRQVNFNGYIQRLIPMLLIWGTMVHEYGHLMAVRVLGGGGVIRSWSLNTMGWIDIPDNMLWFVYLFGGVLQAVYGLYNMVYESDNETWLSGFSVACQGLTYSVFETLNEVELGAIFSIVVTCLVIMLLTFKGTISFE